MTDLVIIQQIAQDPVLSPFLVQTGSGIIANLGSSFAISCLDRLSKVIKQKQKKGEIPEDYHVDPVNRSAMREIFDYLNSGVPDEALFERLQILITAILIGVPERNRLGQFLKIVKQLDHNELTVLFSCYSIYKQGKHRLKDNHAEMRIQRWLTLIAEEAELEYPEIVLNAEKKLQELHLISEKRLNDKTAYDENKETFRLTSLGLKLCEFIEKYQKITE